MKIGVYVGSFNPIHKGHKYVMDYLLENNFVDRVLIIPTANYWDKNNLIKIKDRAEMIKFYSNESIIVNTDLSEYQYTYQILRKLKEENKYDEFHLIIGADNILKFDLWQNYKEILDSKVIILQRGNVNLEDSIKRFGSENFIIATGFKHIEISSTEIRNMIKEENYEGVKKYVDDNIVSYIVKNKLYLN